MALMILFRKGVPSDIYPNRKFWRLTRCKTLFRHFNEYLLIFVSVCASTKTERVYFKGAPQTFEGVVYPNFPLDPPLLVTIIIGLISKMQLLHLIILPSCLFEGKLVVNLFILFIP